MPKYHQPLATNVTDVIINRYPRTNEEYTIPVRALGSYRHGHLGPYHNRAALRQTLLQSGTAITVWHTSYPSLAAWLRGCTPSSTGILLAIQLSEALGQNPGSLFPDIFIDVYA